MFISYVCCNIFKNYWNFTFLYSKSKKKEEANQWFFKNQIKAVITENGIETDIVGNELKKFLQIRDQLFVLIELTDLDIIELWNVSILNNITKF